MQLFVLPLMWKYHPALINLPLQEQQQLGSTAAPALLLCLLLGLLSFCKGHQQLLLFGSFKFSL